MPRLYQYLNNFLEKFPYSATTMWILLLYGPFLGQPVLQTTGDQKVYISQALEMLNRNAWLTQTLAGEPYYYKGPLHYIFLHVGFLVFGTSTPWSTLWMNLACLLIIGLAMVRITVKATKQPLLAVTLGMASTSAAGIYSHAFASQMEVELAATYTVVLWLLTELWHRQRLRTLLGLWTTIGLAGSFKSPLHSALLGFGTLGAMWIPLQCRKILLSKENTFAAFIGVVVGCAGYASLLIVDGPAFTKTYILRETLAKGANEISGWETWLPNLTINLFPFMPLALIGFWGLRDMPLWDRLRHNYKQKIASNDYDIFGLDLVLMAIALSLPTFVFFGLHPYRSMIYTLPCIPLAVFVAGMSLYHTSVLKCDASWLIKTAKLGGLAGLLLPSFYLYAVIHFAHGTWPLPNLLTVAALGVIIMTLMYLFGLRHYQISWSPLWMLSSLPSLLFLGALLACAGNFEIMELRSSLQHLNHDEQHAKIGVYNLHHHTWNEWGLLNVTYGQTIVGLHDEKSLIEWLDTGGVVVFPGKDFLDSFLAKAANANDFNIEPWKKWGVRGRGGAEYGANIAWKKGDMTRLMSYYYILQKKRPWHGDIPRLQQTSRIPSPRDLPLDIGLLGNI